MYCSHCRSALTGEELKCPRCGAPVPKTNINNNINQNNYESNNVQAETSTNRKFEPVMQQSTVEPTIKVKRKFPVVFVLIVLIVIAIIFFIK